MSSAVGYCINCKFAIFGYLSTKIISKSGEFLAFCDNKDLMTHKKVNMVTGAVDVLRPHCADVNTEENPCGKFEAGKPTVKDKRYGLLGIFDPMPKLDYKIKIYKEEK